MLSINGKNEDVRNGEALAANTAVISDLAGTGRTTETVKDNATNIATNTSTLADIAQQQVTLNSAFADIENGAPAAVFATTAALGADATANTTEGKKRAYVVTADGLWYYWDGSAWTAGGTYQATGIADLGVAIRNTFMATRSVNLVDEAASFWKQGRYNSTVTYSITSNKILLAQSTTYYFGMDATQVTAYNIGVFRIEWFDVSDTYVSSQTILNNATFVPTENANISYGRLNLQANLGTDLLAPSDVVNLEVIIAQSEVPVEYVDYYVFSQPENSVDDSHVKNSLKRKVYKSQGNNFKILFISDMHYPAGSGASGYTVKERWDIMVEKINDENEVSPIDFVFVLGDSCSDTTTVQYMPTVLNYLDKLDIPYYIGFGNHEYQSDEDWLDALGYEKNFIISLSGVDLINVATFNDLTEYTEQYGASETDISSDLYTAITNYLTNSVNDKAIILCHYPVIETNFINLVSNEKVICVFCGHQHDETTTADWQSTGKTVYQDGHWSFVVTEATPWSYRILKSTNDILQTYIVHPSVEYTGFTQEREEMSQVTLNTGKGIRIINR
jgi:predicted MPP superfamily phosphohydrolase